MPEVGGRKFEVACQDGEEEYLFAAAKMLDEEARVLAAQIGRLPEARMLLMAGLMLADKTAGLQDELRAARDGLLEKEAELDQVRNARPEIKTDMLAELAARAEALAEQIEAGAQSSAEAAQE